MKKNKLGLCISGGGARGYAVYPIMKRIEELDLKFDHVSGSSVGSIIGAYYCLHGEIDSLYERLIKLKTREWFDLVSLNNPRMALFRRKNIKKFFVDNFFGDKTFSDLKTPLVIVATNLNTKKAEYITKGKLINAVMASTSLPGVFKPYKIKNNFYVDGGVKDNLPVDILFKKNMDRVVGINLNKGSGKRSANASGDALNVILNCLYIMMEDLEVQQRHEDRLFLFEPRFEKKVGDVLKFYQIKENEQAGIRELNKKQESFRKWIKINKLIG